MNYPFVFYKNFYTAYNAYGVYKTYLIYRGFIYNFAKNKPPQRRFWHIIF